MIYAVMNGDVVANIILADKKFVDKFYKGAIDITDLEVRPSIGWIYDGTNFNAPVVIDETLPE